MQTNTEGTSLKPEYPNTASRIIRRRPYSPKITDDQLIYLASVISTNPQQGDISRACKAIGRSTQTYFNHRKEISHIREQIRHGKVIAKTTPILNPAKPASSYTKALPTSSQEPIIERARRRFRKQRTRTTVTQEVIARMANEFLRRPNASYHKIAKASGVSDQTVSRYMTQILDHIRNMPPQVNRQWLPTPGRIEQPLIRKQNEKSRRYLLYMAYSAMILIALWTAFYFVFSY